MKLVEVISSIVTSEATVATLKAFGAALGKTVVEAKDTRGFIVNRLLVPYLLDAVRVLEAGTASREDIDAGMRLGCGHPMGPLALLDFVGLDTTDYIANIMYEEFKEPRFAAPPLLKRMVLAGQLGKKSGQGFYDY
jgi:3-hydroxybutyryl-CoA dehydrogenase